MQTSKLILFVEFTVAILLAVAIAVGSFLEISMTELAVVAGLWDAQLAIVVGAYLWKAKNENRSKHAMKLVKELAETYGIDSVISLAEVILKD